MPDLEISRRRMRSSRLSGTRFTSADEVVRWHGAMQAQDYGPAKWSIGQRATGLHDEDLDQALAAGSILRTHVLRPTWHFVAREDIRWLLALTGPRVQQHNGPRHRELGLDGRTRARCENVIASALAGGNRLTRADIAVVLDHAGIDSSGQRLPYVLMHCELEAVICSGGLEGKQQTYALLDERVPIRRAFDRDAVLIELTRRYLNSHGPATVKDLRWWSGLTVADIKKALDSTGSELRNEQIEGVTLWSVADAGRPAAARGAHLLQAYDELVVGFTESRFLGDPRAAAARAAWKDRSLPTGVVLINGAVAGYWRRRVQPGLVAIEALLYEDSRGSHGRALEVAASDLGRFLGREVTLEMKQL
jgi:hypothetical protein